MRLYVLFLFSISFFSLQILPQSLSIGLGSGVNFITGDNYYTDSFGQLGIYQDVNGTTTNLNGMGLSSEFQFQVIGKYSFNNSPFSLNASFIYLPMRGKEQMDVWYWLTNGEIETTVSTKMDVWSFQFGSIYYFYLASIKPFLSASISSNYFSDTWIELDLGDYIQEYRSYENGMRYGYSFGLGAAYVISTNFDLELSSNYNSFNVLNKREGEVTLNSINILFNIYYKII